MGTRLNTILHSNGWKLYHCGRGDDRHLHPKLKGPSNAQHQGQQVKPPVLEDVKWEDRKEEKKMALKFLLFGHLQIIVKAARDPYAPKCWMGIWFIRIKLKEAQPDVTALTPWQFLYIFRCWVLNWIRIINEVPFVTKKGFQFSFLLGFIDLQQGQWRPAVLPGCLF